MFAATATLHTAVAYATAPACDAHSVGVGLCVGVAAKAWSTLWRCGR